VAVRNVQAIFHVSRASVTLTYLLPEDTGKAKLPVGMTGGRSSKTADIFVFNMALTSL